MIINDIKVLLAFKSQTSIDTVKNHLRDLRRLIFYESKDGTDSQFELTNFVPNILILEDSLGKRSGHQVIEWILASGGKLNNMGIVFVSDKDLPGALEDAQTVGRIHIVSNQMDVNDVKLAFIKAFNYYTGSFHHEFRTRLLQEEDVLITQGEKADNVYLLKKGRLIANQLANSKLVYLGEILPGEFVGEMAYINQEMRSATVTATEARELIEIPIQFADQVLFRRPSWAKALMRTLSKRLKRSNREASTR